MSKRKYLTVRQILGKRSPWTLQLAELITIVESLFPSHKKDKFDGYNFTLGKFPRGWSFRVVNSWHTWLKKGYDTDFGLWDKPEHCLSSFLEYCIKHRIKPIDLIEK